MKFEEIKHKQRDKTNYMKMNCIDVEWLKKKTKKIKDSTFQTNEFSWVNPAFESV